MGKKIAKILFYLLMLIIVLVNGYFIYNYTKDKDKQKTIDETSSIELVEKEVKSLEYYKEYYSNDEIIGSLKIEGTQIDTLLVKSTNNEYYLNHSLKKEYDAIGSIYVDYRVNLNSKQINIYGHNSNVYDVMFKELEKYLNKDYYENHKYIVIWDGNQYFTYQIFSLQIVTTNYEHMNVNPTDWNKHINILNKSIYDTGIKATGEDNILVLQTCNYSPKNSYLIVIAKKI